MESRLETLEVKMMEMELTVDQLNAVVIEQQQTIARLLRRVDHFEQLLQHDDGPATVKPEDEPPPPHY